MQLKSKVRRSSLKHPFFPAWGLWINTSCPTLCATARQEDSPVNKSTSASAGSCFSHTGGALLWRGLSSARSELYLSRRGGQHIRLLLSLLGCVTWPPRSRILGISAPTKALSYSVQLAFCNTSKFSRNGQKNNWICLFWEEWQLLGRHKNEIGGW